MMNKIKEILNSIRFWEVVLSSVLVYLGAKGWVGEAERNLLVGILGASLILGSADSIAKKLNDHGHS